MHGESAQTQFLRRLLANAPAISMSPQRAELDREFLSPGGVPAREHLASQFEPSSMSAATVYQRAICAYGRQIADARARPRR